MATAAICTACIMPCMLISMLHCLVIMLCMDCMFMLHGICRRQMQYRTGRNSVDQKYGEQ